MLRFTQLNMTQYFKTFFSLIEYSKLNFDDKLKNYLFEKEIINIPTDFINDPIINLKENSHKFIFAEEMTDFRCRSILAKKLVDIDTFLQKNHNYRLKIFETYRPLKIQRETFEQIKSEIIAANPGLTKDEIWAKTTEFIADPTLCPPHSTGGAVDLLIIDSKGKSLDFGTEINSVNPKSSLFCPDLSNEAKQNRQLLLKLMLDHEIAPMCTEWWHYSYGEAYWAAIYDKKRIYESLDL